MDSIAIDHCADSANQRARRMYERRGWVLRPGLEEDASGVTVVRYRRELLSAPRRDDGCD
jgi:hypothetical protein